MFCVQNGVFAVIYSLVTVFLFSQKSFTLYSATYTLELYQKIIIVSLMFILFCLLNVLNFFLDRKYKNEYFNVHQVSFVAFLVELLVVLAFGALMKAWAFGFNMFYVIFITQGILLFLNVPLNTYIILLIMRLSKNFYKGDGNGVFLNYGFGQDIHQNHINYNRKNINKLYYHVKRFHHLAGCTNHICTGNIFCPVFRR